MILLIFLTLDRHPRSPEIRVYEVRFRTHAVESSTRVVGECPVHVGRKVDDSGTIEALMCRGTYNERREALTLGASVGVKLLPRSFEISVPQTPRPAPGERSRESSDHQIYRQPKLLHRAYARVQARFPKREKQILKRVDSMRISSNPESAPGKAPPLGVWLPISRGARKAMKSA
jgi:hypothetical protein